MNNVKDPRKAQELAVQMLPLADAWQADIIAPVCTNDDFKAIVMDDAQPTQYQIAACRALCEYSLRMTEVVDYEQRLQALEDEMRR